MQHPTISPLFPIPARVVPRSWEDLASYISRVATEMGYRNPGWILHPEGVVSTVQPYNLCRLSRKADYQFLQHLLYLNEETLYNLTLHRFSLCFMEPEVSTLPSLSEEIQRPLLTQYIFQMFFHPYSATKVCSVCLTEEPAYGRLYWCVLPVVACLRHRVFLTDRCPICQSPIPLFRPSLSKCPRCHRGDYREAPIIHMPGDPFFTMGQDLILLNLGIQCTSQNTEVIDVSRTPLLQLLPWQYFLLLDAFRCIIGPLFPDAPFLQVSADARTHLRQRPRPQSALSLLEWSVIIATLHWLCTSWPDNFFEFLGVFPHARNGRRRKRDRQRATGLHLDFGVFYEKWLYKRLTHHAFTFIHEAFEAYLRSHYTGGEVTTRLLPFRRKSEESIQERPYLTKVQARSILGIGEGVLQSLIHKGVLRVQKKSIGLAEKRHMFLIDKESVEVLKREWGDLIPLVSVARSYLGVTKTVVLALEEASVLLPRRGPNVDGYKYHLYSKTDIEQFEKVLLLYSVKADLSSVDCLPLPSVSRRTGLALVTLLKEVFDNNLLLIELDMKCPLLQRFVIRRGDICCFLEKFKARQCEKLELFTPIDVANQLGVSERVLRRWAQLGLIESEMLAIGGRKATLVFRKKAVESFCHAYAFSDEVAQLLQVHPHTVIKYVSQGKLHPVTGKRSIEGGNRLVFRRVDIEDSMKSVLRTANNIKTS